MTVLSTAERNAIARDIMRTADCPGNITKVQLRETIDAMDDWWETVAAAGNQAIPLPQRTLLSQKQKASLFTRILNARYEREV